MYRADLNDCADELSKRDYRIRHRILAGRDLLSTNHKAIVDPREWLVEPNTTAVERADTHSLEQKPLDVCVNDWVQEVTCRPTSFARILGHHVAEVIGATPSREVGASSSEMLAVYHRLVDKRFDHGLTPEEDRELQLVNAELDRVEQVDPVEQTIAMEASRRIAILEEVVKMLQSLERES